MSWHLRQAEEYTCFNTQNLADIGPFAIDAPPSRYISNPVPIITRRKPWPFMIFINAILYPIGALIETSDHHLPSSSIHSADNPHSFTTLSCPCPPLFRSIPFGLIPPCALLLSLSRPLSTSCLPPSRTRLFFSTAAESPPPCLSSAWFKVPRRVSPAPWRSIGLVMIGLM